MPELFVNQYRDYFQREVLKEHEYSIDEIEKAITILTKDSKCVFLKDDKTCAIYNDRPQPCRDFGHGIGDMECHRVAPSGRIRNPEEVKRALKRLQKADNVAGDSDIVKKVSGIQYKFI